MPGPFIQPGGPPGMPPVPGGPPQGPPAGMPAPGAPGPQYKAVPQSDGTILLQTVLPDGTLGPVVSIVKAPKGAKGVNPPPPPTGPLSQ